MVNEARSGSSWLQEISQMHPGIMVQFELDLSNGDSALSCMECSRSKVPDSKHLGRIPPKLHPPLACGMTIFGSSNRFVEVKQLADRHNAVLVILLRLNHVAHAISSYRHFNQKSGTKATYESIQKPGEAGMIQWQSAELVRAVEEMRESYVRLLQFPARTGRRAHIVFYEDLKHHPKEVWEGLQKFLLLPIAIMEGLEMLERKSTDRPSIYFLQDLPSLQAELADQDWADMLLDPNFDEHVNTTAAFTEACHTYPKAFLSWRKNMCSAGKIRDSEFYFSSEGLKTKVDS